MDCHTVLTFSKNDWVSVRIPSGLDGQELYYASVYASLTQDKGVDVKKAKILAEAAAMKRLYPGLMYGSVLERDLQILRE
jgi:hypothetical protein